ncbi:MAG: phosphate transport regulator-like protein [Rhodocyclaceae bacterium]|nr:phosphate transport regulator-like protein [Rhodocyclaceae bacterium]
MNDPTLFSPPAHPSLFRRLFERVFPKTPDFFALLAEQCFHVSHSTGLLVDYMESGDPEVGLQIRQDEHDADRVKARNLHTLNEAFSTPIDREDIYRAIVDLDEIVNYCKTTVSEMDVLGVKPDKHSLEIALHIKLGVDALVTGYAKLATQPAAAAEDADNARRAERKAEKAYRRAIADLFQGDDYINMFKRREIYRHLSNAADRVANCANTLHDIVVKIC